MQFCMAHLRTRGGGGQIRRLRGQQTCFANFLHFHSPIPLLRFLLRSGEEEEVDFACLGVYHRGMMEKSRLREFQDIDAILGCGVYALFFYRELVYVGKAKRLLHRVYAHRNMWERTRQRKKLPTSGPFSAIKPIRFNGVGVQLCKEVDLDRIEQAMITKYRPKYNTNLKPEGRISLEEMGFDFKLLLKPPAEPRLERRRV